MNAISRPHETSALQAGTWPDAPFLPQVLDHYHRVGPLLEQSFAGAPIVYVDFPAGFDQPPYFHVTDIPLSSNKLLWLVHRTGAIEFHTWAPLPEDLDRLRFARLLIELRPGTSYDRAREAATKLRAHLREDGVDAIPLVDPAGIALWIPLADAPHAAAVRTWLHALSARAVAASPSLFSTEPNTVDDGRVHLHVSSNARGRFSALPYSLRGGPHLHVVTPIAWPELDSIDPFAQQAATFADRLSARGDVFAAETARIGTQRLPLESPKPREAIAELPSSAPRGHVIVAAVTILEDGRSRTADQILTEALAANLVPPTTTRKYIYSSLIEYIARQLGRGRKPLLVQDHERNFRINEPADDWPDLVPFSPPEPDAAATALIARLESTAVGDDPSAFEIACCDVFAHLGFQTRHLGAHAEPDGIADAQLGPLGYRVLLECKTAKSIVAQPDAAEASKFTVAFTADYATLIGPDFSEETQLAQELQTHAVTAFTVADLSTLLSLRANALELRAILAPGFAVEPIGDLLWERRHGRPKRIATIAALIHREAWSAQITAAAQNARANAPHLTIDAAMLLVDAFLHAANSTQACRREEAEAAFTHLTDPLVNAATWLDESKTAIVILTEARPPANDVP